MKEPAKAHHTNGDGTSGKNGAGAGAGGGGGVKRPELSMPQRGPSAAIGGGGGGGSDRRERDWEVHDDRGKPGGSVSTKKTKW